MDNPYVTCALCGHQFPASFVRERGGVTCSCGLRIENGPRLRTRHHLRNVLFLFATALLVPLAATIGRRFLG